MMPKDFTLPLSELFLMEAHGMCSLVLATKLLLLQVTDLPQFLSESEQQDQDQLTLLTTSLLNLSEKKTTSPTSIKSCIL